MKNCVNCGAVLQGNICEYCGTHYDDNDICASFSKDDYKGIIKIGDEEIKVYIGSMEAHTDLEYAYRDCNGMLHRAKPKMKRKFTFIEY